jgi:hypothetical protein
MQEVFDKMVTRLIAQGRPAWDENESSCMYRDERGGGCAVGVVLTDKQIELLRKEDANSETGVARLPTEVLASLREQCGDPDPTGSYYQPNNLDRDPTWPPQYKREMRFLMAMQDAHDRDAEEAGDNPAAWLHQFRLSASRVAAEFELDQACLNNEATVPCAPA